MSNKMLAAIAVCAVLFCTAFAQQPAKIPNAVEEPKILPSVEGRYKPIVKANTLYLVDTQTGQCWERTGNNLWTDMGSPVKFKE